MQGRVFRQTTKNTFSSEEQLRVGVDGQVKVWVWVTEFELPNDPTAFIEIIGFNSTGDRVAEFLEVFSNNEFVTTNEFAEFNYIAIQGDFLVRFRQEPPRASAGEAHEKGKARQNWAGILFVGIATVGGVGCLGYMVKKKDERLYA